MRRRHSILAITGLATLTLSGSAPIPTPPQPKVAHVEVAPKVFRAPLESFPSWEIWIEAVRVETLADDALAPIIAREIAIASTDFNLNPWLLCSLIRIESSGRPDIVSHAGAVGLTQVLPGTAEEIAGELGIETFDLTDPSTNIRMGAFYLARLMERFEGDENAALAAYNWGPTHIASRLREGESLPTVYAEKILARLE